MNILLTGSSGYIGARLAPLLRDLGHRVVGLDRVSNDTVELDLFHQTDINDLGNDLHVFDGIDMIMHLAAAKGDWGISADEFYQDNLYATQRLVEDGTKAGIKKWLFYSTVAVLGPSDERISESAPYSPVIPYGASKSDCEKIFAALCESDAAQEVLILRPSAVFGIDNPPSTNIFRLIDAVKNGRMIMIGDGKVLKTTSYIENLLAATLFLNDRIEPGLGIYHYVDEPIQSTGELVQAVYDGLEKTRPKWYLPLFVAYPLAFVLDVISALVKKDLPITAARIKKFCTATVFDSSSIRELGFRQPVDNKKAIATTIKWHLKSRN